MTYVDNPRTSRAEVLLIGDPVAQSVSPAFQNAGFVAADVSLRYGTRRVDARGAGAAIGEVASGALHGLNVTAPHKRVAWECVDERTAVAGATGAVNTVWSESGVVWGDNTDVHGVAVSLAVLSSGTRVVILGAGGAAASAAVAALDGGASVVVCNRTQARAEELAGRLSAAGFPGVRTAGWGDHGCREALRNADTVINATALGLGSRSRAAEAFRGAGLDTCAAHAWLDLSYAAEPTEFLSQAPPGAATLDGATMLLHQGVAAFERWTLAPAPLDAMRAALAGALGRPAEALGVPV